MTIFEIQARVTCSNCHGRTLDDRGDTCPNCEGTGKEVRWVSVNALAAQLEELAESVV